MAQHLASVAGLALAVLLVLGAVALGHALSPTAAASELYGVRFGMNAEQVRQGFQDAARGDWSFHDSGVYDTLHWQRSGAGSPRAVTFVFHEGILSAARLQVDSSDRLAPPAPSESESFFETTRAVAGDATLIKIVARGCTLTPREFDALVAH